MSNRDSHAGKSLQQKESYKRYLTNIDYEPTLDDSLQFNNTEKAGEDLSESTIKKRRPVSLKYQIIEYVKEYWFSYLIAGFVIICLYLINETRIVNKLFDYKLSELKSSFDKMDVKSEEHNKTIIENKIKIEMLEKKFK